MNLQTLFENTGINKELLPILEHLDIINPTPIQEKTIPLLMENRDIVAQSNTGTGKTLAYGIPMVHRITESGKEIQGLIMAPTRELADQITSELKTISRYKNLKLVRVCGGKSITTQMAAIRRNPHIIVATPGRLLDLIGRNAIDLDWVQFLVIDEADLMLEMGFIGDIEKIIECIGCEHQTGLFSATFPKQIVDLSNEYQKNSVKVLMDKENKIPESKLQQYYFFTTQNKSDALLDLVGKLNPQKAIVFCRTRYESAKVHRLLKKSGINAVAINGDMSQNQRDKSLYKFKQDDTTIIVATDLLSRGIHVDDIDYIINMNIPFEHLTYFHRIGRTARIGNKGKSITLVAPYEKRDLINLKRATDLKISEFEGSEPNDIKTLELEPSGHSQRKSSSRRPDQYNRRNRFSRGRQNRSYSSRDRYPKDNNRSDSNDNNRSYSNNNRSDSNDNKRSYSRDSNRSYSRDNKRSYSSKSKDTTPRRSYDRKFKKTRITRR